MRADTKLAGRVLPGTRGRRELGTGVRADRVRAGSVVTISGLGAVEKRDPRLARRLQELGLQPGVRMEIGKRTAGGGRVVTVGDCRYAIDSATLRRVEVRR